jgi:alpha-glucoside transport system substrate-binding protein
MKRTVLTTAALCLALLTPTACSSPEKPRTVRMLGLWTDKEAEAFRKVVEPFEKQTGIKVDYEGSPDLSVVLDRRVEGGDPPELAALSSPGDLLRFARSGAALPLGDIPEIAASDAQYNADWRILGEVEGTRRAVVVKSTLKSMIWYSPQGLPERPTTWPQLVEATRRITATGKTPWCVGLASSSTSGWPGTDWIEDIVLARSGVGVYDRWVKGELPWISPEIRAAWEAWGELVSDRAMYGGALGAMLTPYGDSAKTLAGGSGGCVMEHQASFAAGWYGEVKTASGAPAKAGTDYDTMPFPTFPGTPAAGQPREVGGDVMAMFKDTPEARKLLAYLVSAEAQTLWVKGGGTLSANQQVPPDAYPDEVSRRLGQELAKAPVVRFDASDRMPTELRNAFQQAALRFIANPQDLEKILTSLDRVRTSAYP